VVVLETDDYVHRRYSRRGAPWVDFSIIFSKDNRKGTHPPDLCLEGSGQEIILKRDVVAHGIEGRGSVPCRELIAQRKRDRKSILYMYTYKCGDTYTRSFWWQQLTILANGLLRRNATGALIEVSTPLPDGSLNDARNRLMNTLRTAIPHLDRGLRT